MGCKYTQMFAEHVNRESKAMGEEHDVQKAEVYAYCLRVRPDRLLK